MVTAVNNPTTGFTGLVDAATSTVGQAVQGGNQAKADVNDQQAITEGTGDSKAVDAQRSESSKSDANQAALIGLQGEETRRKQTQDVLNAIQSGKEDSANKKISATAQNAKGISF
ncbi:hypothetical protein [Pseudomonas typographi]|uniref:HrpA n=1 Tax=Pseudomonas typographi TaxID=2715964 RepID=A0ABR7Z306_9PSED|nr:hypothetical protein [Pseudomonas typographi]MBD1589590.1 hypothetical protein [Pseudomonas typographi]MBD1599778.1 hypothetical protein [Pseudomonas typographi]